MPRDVAVGRGLAFWQRGVSPHMSGLADAFSELGYSVAYVATHLMSEERRAQGWSTPVLRGANLRMIRSVREAIALAETMAPSVIHIVQGLRRNGYISEVSDHLRGMRWGALLETVDDRGMRGIAKRLDYRFALRAGVAPDFVLAVGEGMSRWVSERGFPSSRVYPFAYFLPEVQSEFVPRANRSFHLGFVGQLIRRKRVDLLLSAAASLSAEVQISLVGSGNLEGQLKAYARMNGIPVSWLGTMSMSDARSFIAELDCLVLPSDHDGWGAVVSEALLAGTPVVCSDGCGAAAVVRASGRGGVFARGDAQELSLLLESAVSRGPVAVRDRQALRLWARCLGADAGARYLAAIIDAVYGDGAHPLPPWLEPQEDG